MSREKQEVALENTVPVAIRGHSAGDFRIVRWDCRELRAPAVLSALAEADEDVARAIGYFVIGMAVPLRLRHLPWATA